MDSARPWPQSRFSIDVGSPCFAEAYDSLGRGLHSFTYLLNLRRV